MSLESLKKIAAAKSTQGGNFIRDGRYRFLITNVIGEAKFAGDFFIPEFRVVSAEKVLPDVEPNAIGTSCSCAWNLSTNKSAPGNAKAFVLGTLGADESTASESEVFETLREVVSEKQPLRGMLVGCETFRGVIKSGANAGKPITKLRWTHVEQTEEDIAKRRVEIESPK